MFSQKILFVTPLVLPLIVCGDARIQGPHALLAEADRLAMLYNWPKAVPLYAQAQLLAETSGDDRTVLLARIGYAWATASAGSDPGIREQVSDWLKDASIQADPQLMLRVMVTKAFLDRNSNEATAKESWNQILDLATKVSDKRWEERAKAEIGQIQYMDGDVRSATAMFREAIIWLYLHWDLGAAIHYTAMVGNGLVESGRPETGLQYCNTALRMSFVTKDSGFPFLAYQGKARALIAMHRTSEAEDILDKAVVRARTEKNILALAELLVVAGTAAVGDDPGKAVKPLEEAAAISDASGFHHVFAWSTFELAKVYRASGNLSEADLLASRTIRIMRDLDDRYHLPQHLALLAEVKAREGDFERADQLYSEATDVIDGLLVNVNSRQLKSTLIATLSDAYIGHFELAVSKFGDPNRAYDIIEQARGRTLADTLRGYSENLSTDPITAGAQKEISRLQVALMRETDRKERESLLDNLFLAEQLLSRVDRVERSSAERPKPVSLRMVQASLRSDEVILEYVLAEPRSYCLRITRSETVVLPLPAGRKGIEDLVTTYLSAVQSQAEDKFSQDLFSIVLAPVLGKNTEARLIIIPDGKLHLLPFDAVKDSGANYVLRSHVVTYAPSATVLHLLRQLRSPYHPAKNFLGVGGVLYSGVRGMQSANNAFEPPKNATADFFDVESASFPDLPGSELEVVTAAGIINQPHELLLGKGATERAFKTAAQMDFMIIHLAVHGAASIRFPDRAALLLAPSPESSDDGLLQAREISELRLRAELVTLSSCETGNGKLLGEEGIASLENAFLMAGAKAVLASLWTADDQYTVALMKHFYEHLTAGNDTGAALRKAKTDLLEKFGESTMPVYWAGFKLIGDGVGQIFN